MSWFTLMAYFVLSPNGEESLNKFLSLDPDHLTGGQSHGHNTSCKNKVYIDQSNISDEQTCPNVVPSHYSSEGNYNCH